MTNSSLSKSPLTARLLTSFSNTLHALRQRARYSVLVMLVVVLALTVSAVSTPHIAQAQISQFNWLAYYWNNKDFAGGPVYTRNETQLNFNWGGGSPDPSVPADNFSARYYTNITVTTAGNFLFRVGADDGARVAVDNVLVLDKFANPAGGFFTGTSTVFLAAGPHQLIVDYYETTGNAGLLFDITPQGGALSPGTITNPSGATATTAPGATAVPGSFPTAIPTPSGPLKGVVIVNRTNVRGGPGVNFPQIGEATKDQVFLLLARNGDFGLQTWFLVDLGNGTRGWIARINLYPYNGETSSLPKSSEVTSAPVAPGGSTTTTIITGVALSDVVVRDRASLNGARIAVIPRGQSFTIVALSRTNRAWVKVDLADVKGWVYTPNIRVTSGSLGALPRE